jgi:hypothetical protein
MVRRAEEIGPNCPPPLSRQGRPAEFIVTGDRQFDLASSVRSPVQTRSTFYRYPFCRWPARFSGLDSRRGRCLAETPAERLRFSGGRDSETGSGARSLWRLLRTLAFKVGRRVRISFAPAQSHQRTGGRFPPYIVDASTLRWRKTAYGIQGRRGTPCRRSTSPRFSPAGAPAAPWSGYASSNFAAALWYLFLHTHGFLQGLGSDMTAAPPSIT